MKKSFIYIIITVVTAALLSVGAQASTIDSAVKTLDSSLNQLVTAKDDTTENKLTPEEDLAYRKKVINDALALSLKEIGELRNKLNSFEFADKSTEADLRKQYLSDLDKFESVYKDFQGKLDEETSLDGVKNIAKDTKEYRDNTYTPDTIQILNFVFTFQTSKLTESAKIRYEKIETDIDKLEKANFIEDGYFTKQMAEAKKFISDAEGLVNKAKDAILKPEISDENKKETESDIVTPPTPKELCEASLVNLKSAYNVFVNISSAVKKLIK